MPRKAVNPGVPESPTRGEGVHICTPDLADRKSLGLHPSLEQSQRQGEGSQQRHPLQNHGAQNSLGKDPRPTRTVECLDVTGPQGCSLGAGSPVWGAGLLALGQTRCLGERCPSEGHAVLSPSCRAQAGKSRREGGAIPLLARPAVGSLPHFGRWRDWYPPPSLPSSPQFHFAISRLQERCQRALGQGACCRREHSCRT